MKKVLTTLVAAVGLLAVVVASSAPAEARWGGGWHGGGWRGGGWGWGVGGFAAGALVGSALAAPYYYNGYYPYPYPYYGRPCVWRRVWNGYNWVRACV